jgi:hypothetical protein
MDRRRREIERSRLLNRPIPQNHYKRRRLAPNPVVEEFPDTVRNSPQENEENFFEHKQTSEDQVYYNNDCEIMYVST